MFESTGFFYLYLYPIVSSIFAGVVFWFFFSFLPEAARKRSIGIGVTNDLITLNYLLFHYFDLFLKPEKYVPSLIQDKIHASSLSAEELNILLQNKITDKSFDVQPKYSEKMVEVGDEIEVLRAKIDETIKRLFAFNIYLSSKDVDLLRGIREKIFRYETKRNVRVVVGGQEYRILNYSLSYMSDVLFELQGDFAKFRKLVFGREIHERTFVISKIQMLYYSGRFKECIKSCKRWILQNPFDADLQKGFLALSLFSLGQKNKGYQILESLLDRNPDVVSQRGLLYPLLSDPTALAIMHKKASIERVEEMRKICEAESLQQKQLMAQNAEMKAFVASLTG